MKLGGSLSDNNLLIGVDGFLSNKWIYIHKNILEAMIQ